VLSGTAAGVSTNRRHRALIKPGDPAFERHIRRAVDKAHGTTVDDLDPLQSGPGPLGDRDHLGRQLLALDTVAHQNIGKQRLAGTGIAQRRGKVAEDGSPAWQTFPIRSSSR
jgi:hypothetical protein